MPSINPEIGTYIKEELKKSIPEEDVEISFFVEKLIAQNLFDSLNKSSANRVYKNIKTTIEYLNKNLFSSTEFDFEETFRILKCITSKLLINSVLFAKQSYTYKVPDYFSKFKFFISIIKNAVEKIREDNINPFLSLDPNFSFFGVNQIIFNCSFKYKIESCKIIFHYLSKSNDILISKSQNIKLSSIINKISSNYKLIKEKHLEPKYTNSIPDESISSYRLDNIVYGVRSTVYYTGPAIVWKKLLENDLELISIAQYINSGIYYSTTHTSETQFFEIIKLSNSSTKQNTTLSNNGNICFTDTIESNISACLISENQKYWKELLEYFRLSPSKTPTKHCVHDESENSFSKQNINDLGENVYSEVKNISESHLASVS